MAKLNRIGEVFNAVSNAFKGKTRKPKAEENPFDIFPSWFKSVFSRKADKDRETNQEKDGYSTGVETYLARKKAHKKRTSVDFNDDQYVIKTPFSSPSAEQENAAPTNMGEYSELEQGGIEYADPVISTKPTPTSERMGVPRPGPSTFIQTARYNPQTKQLNIQYTDGKIFPYQNVSMEMADRILNKRAYHSPGQTLLDTIFYGHGTTKADEISDIEEGM
jgi:hypothetical protein